MSAQWDMMRELSSMQDRMNRIWGTMYDRGREDVSGHGAWLPPVDIYETADQEIVSWNLVQDGCDVSVDERSVIPMTPVAVGGVLGLGGRLPLVRPNRLPTATPEGDPESTDAGEELYDGARTCALLRPA